MSFKYDYMNRDFEPWSFEKDLTLTGKTSTHTQKLNFNGDIVIFEFTHKILKANGNEVTSTGSSRKVIKEDLLNEN
jgi:hypothetical protein